MKLAQVIRLIVFDMGGTTVHDTADVATCFCAALEHHGLAVTADELATWRGAAKREVIDNAIRGCGRSDLDPAEVYRTFRTMLLNAFKQAGVRPVCGAAAAFRRLRESGIGVVLTTGFDAQVAAWLMNRLQWGSAVDGLVTADDVRTGRPAPDMIYRAMEQFEVEDVRHVVVVGDTTNDVEAGHRAGVRASIGVVTGAHDRKRLEGAAPTVVLESAAEVPAWLAGTVA